MVESFVFCAGSWYIYQATQRDIGKLFAVEIRVTKMSQLLGTMSNIQDDPVWQLHLRAACGEPLTPTEQAQLQAWYAAQEMAEMAMLKLETSSVDIATLQTQINAMLAQIATATYKIKQLTDENEALRRDVVLLRRQLHQQAILQPV